MTGEISLSCEETHKLVIKGSTSARILNTFLQRTQSNKACSLSCSLHARKWRL